MTRVLVPLAEGCEEIEAVTIIDTLRRAGIQVTSAGLKPGPVTASRGVRLIPDVDWPASAWPGHFDAIVLPGGGPGTQHLMADSRVIEALRAFHAAGRWVAAICAAPMVLHKAGVLAGKSFTCYPGVEQNIHGGTHQIAPVVRDGKVITGRGPGTSVAFALTLVEVLVGEKIARDVGVGLLAGGG